MNTSRFFHGLFAAEENWRESALTSLNPNHRTRLEQKGVPETNPFREEREIIRMTRPLKPLTHDLDNHELAVHQGLYIDPYLWEFGDGGRRRDGSRKLQIICYMDPDLRL
jgi:hypothetical protein